ncbi:NUDIX domain-containing protein [Streptomyces sp. Ag109_G2-6]|uniref:NUDIX domain-containing protein n=1 Tax=Streptomyces sp. Ag109_G2-6 TaxID=2485154 RepID=UPI000F4D5CCC|nr:NUDIX domain-containing protein [Streptomyces sp. Ag109_G2-6]RPF40161.1 NUDIX domain-containing protein [Streptomyces sp. Ag109_G2-6]
MTARPARTPNPQAAVPAVSATVRGAPRPRQDRHPDENAKLAQGMWDLPVGKSEPGEPITETAVRELYEETGLTVKPESLKVAHIIHGAWGVEAPNGFLTVVFAANEWTGEPENREPRKHSQVRWVDADAIPDAFVDTTSSALRQYLNAGPEDSLNGW